MKTGTTWPEFLEYIDDCTPYTIENIKFTGEERVYTLLGKEVPDHPDRLENRISMSM